MARDLDYAGALRLAKSLQPKPAGVIGTPDSKAATKAEVSTAVQKVASVKARAMSPLKQSPKEIKAKDEAAKNPQTISAPKKAKAEVALPDAAKAKKETKKTPAKGRAESPAKK